MEPGFRGIKNPAAIAPVWLEKPEWIAALAMLTILGLLVYSVMQRQVRLYLRMPDQQLPGHKGMTAPPRRRSTGWSVTHWASTPRGMLSPQPQKTTWTFRPLERGLEPAKEVVTYSDKQECLDKLLYFLDHEDEARAIGRAGQARPLRDHTYRVRMAELVRILRDVISRQGGKHAAERTTDFGLAPVD